MRHSFLAVAVAMATTLAAAMPAGAGSYYSYGQRQTCVVKAVKTYGAYGRVVIKKARICK